MSIRAYRINKIEREDTPSLNLWHDTEIFDWLNEQEDYNGEQLNESGGGQIEISVKTLEKLLTTDFMKEGYQRKVIQSDIDFAKAQDDEYVLYDCF